MRFQKDEFMKVAKNTIEKVDNNNADECKKDDSSSFLELPSPRVSNSLFKQNPYFQSFDLTRDDHHLQEEVGVEIGISDSSPLQLIRLLKQSLRDTLNRQKYELNNINTNNLHQEYIGGNPTDTSGISLAKHILVIGATGSIGARLTAHLLGLSKNNIKVSCILRKKREGNNEKRRFIKVLEDLKLWSEVRYKEKVQIFTGDFNHGEQLGLKTKDYNYLIESVDLIVFAALPVPLAIRADAEMNIFNGVATNRLLGLHNVVKFALKNNKPTPLSIVTHLAYDPVLLGCDSLHDDIIDNSSSEADYESDSGNVEIRNNKIQLSGLSDEDESFKLLDIAIQFDEDITSNEGVSTNKKNVEPINFNAPNYKLDPHIIREQGPDVSGEHLYNFPFQSSYVSGSMWATLVVENFIGIARSYGFPFNAYRIPLLCYEDETNTESVNIPQLFLKLCLIQGEVPPSLHGGYSFPLLCPDSVIKRMAKFILYSSKGNMTDVNVVPTCDDASVYSWISENQLVDWIQGHGLFSHDKTRLTTASTYEKWKQIVLDMNFLNNNKNIEIEATSINDILPLFMESFFKSLDELAPFWFVTEKTLTKEKRHKQNEENMSICSDLEDPNKLLHKKCSLMCLESVKAFPDKEIKSKRMVKILNGNMVGATEQVQRHLAISQRSDNKNKLFLDGFFNYTTKQIHNVNPMDPDQLGMDSNIIKLNETLMENFNDPNEQGNLSSVRNGSFFVQSTEGNNTFTAGDNSSHYPGVPNFTSASSSYDSGWPSVKQKFMLLVTDLTDNLPTEMSKEMSRNWMLCDSHGYEEEYIEWIFRQASCNLFVQRQVHSEALQAFVTQKEGVDESLTFDNPSSPTVRTPRSSVREFPTTTHRAPTTLRSLKSWYGSYTARTTSYIDVAKESIELTSLINKEEILNSDMVCHSKKGFTKLLESVLSNNFDDQNTTSTMRICILNRVIWSAALSCINLCIWKRELEIRLNKTIRSTGSVSNTPRGNNKPSENVLPQLKLDSDSKSESLRNRQDVITSKYRLCQSMVDSSLVITSLDKNISPILASVMALNPENFKVFSSAELLSPAAGLGGRGFMDLDKSYVSYRMALTLNSKPFATNVRCSSATGGVLWGGETLKNLETDEPVSFLGSLNATSIYNDSCISPKPYHVKVTRKKYKKTSKGDRTTHGTRSSRNNQTEYEHFEYTDSHLPLLHDYRALHAEYMFKRLSKVVTRPYGAASRTELRERCVDISPLFEILGHSPTFEQWLYVPDYLNWVEEELSESSETLNFVKDFLFFLIWVRVVFDWNIPPGDSDDGQNFSVTNQETILPSSRPILIVPPSLFGTLNHIPGVFRNSTMVSAHNSPEKSCLDYLSSYTSEVLNAEQGKFLKSSMAKTTVRTDDEQVKKFFHRTSTIRHPDSLKRKYTSAAYLNSSEYDSLDSVMKRKSIQITCKYCCNYDNFRAAHSCFQQVTDSISSPSRKNKVIPIISINVNNENNMPTDEDDFDDCGTSSSMPQESTSFDDNICREDENIINIGRTGDGEGDVVSGGGVVNKGDNIINDDKKGDKLVQFESIADQSEYIVESSFEIDELEQVPENNSFAFLDTNNNIGNKIMPILDISINQFYLNPSQTVFKKIYPFAWQQHEQSKKVKENTGEIQKADIPNDVYARTVDVLTNLTPTLTAAHLVQQMIPPLVPRPVEFVNYTQLFCKDIKQAGGGAYHKNKAPREQQLSDIVKNTALSASKTKPSFLDNVALPTTAAINKLSYKVESWFKNKKK